MSKENRYGRRLPAAATAASIVSPMTNCPARMRIAWRTAPRTTGSPRRATTRLTWSGASCQPTSLPVSISAQSAALALLQSPAASFSRSSASCVAASGILSSASATHISATPSGVDSP